MGQRAKPWFLTERAEHLAIVVLTRSPKITMNSLRLGTDMDIDLIVKLDQETSSQRKLGVVTRGVRKYRDIHKELILDKKRYQKIQQELKFPVGVLIFDMTDDDQGYWGWLLKPSLPQTKEPQLEPTEILPLEPFDRQKLEEMLQLVTNWYEAQERATHPSQAIP